jgi:hypothetical protein
VSVVKDLTTAISKCAAVAALYVSKSCSTAEAVELFAVNPAGSYSVAFADVSVENND